jgi:hypothetical protein
MGIDYANPYQLDDEVEFLTGAGRNWVDCVNAGFSRCRANIVHLLGAGTQVEERWTQHALEHFAADEMGLVTPLVVSASEPARIISAGVRYGLGGSRFVVTRATQGASNLAPSSTAGFYRLEMLARLGGYSSAVGDEYADLDLALRAAAAGWRIASEPRSRVFGRLLPPPTREFRSGRCAEQFFWRHLPNRRTAFALAGHAVGIAGEILSSAVRPGNLLHCVGRLGAIWPAREIRPDLSNVAIQDEALTANLLGMRANVPPPHPPMRRRVA